tara:strand:- start:2771 stop:3577 length:807 start_codon:yes stop_codon:yes gene_type:complete
MNITKKQCVLSISGGMDSSSLMLNLLANDYEVTALSFDYGQKHKAELLRAQSLVKYLGDNGIRVRHQIIDLSTLTPLLNSALVSGGNEVPEGHYENENMKATVVPNRNKIFSSLIQSVALSIANETEQDVKIALGIHAGDHAIYPDCRQEFRDADYQAFLEGNWDAEKVSFYTPYLELMKAGILEDGLKSCEKLGIDFDEVYARTLTSYKPIQIDGRWYSDYKSASSVERVEAFIEIGRKDPAPYADETGPVTWDAVKKDVSKVLSLN